MTAGQEKALSERSTDSRTEDEVGGDNPGVGGLPAKEEPFDEDADSRAEDEAGGDNPGVGGMPAEKPTSKS
jgi:hypothetical protein